MTKLMSIRKIDHLGRLTIPSSIRSLLNINEGQDIEITLKYGKLCLRVFDPEVNICSLDNVGIVRQIDQLGRISVPPEYLKLINAIRGETNFFVTFKENNDWILCSKIPG